MAPKEPSPLFKKSPLGGSPSPLGKKEAPAPQKPPETRQIPVPSEEALASTGSQGTAEMDVQAELDAAFAEVDKKIDSGELSGDTGFLGAGSESGKFTGDVTGQIDDIFASFESKIDEDMEEHAAKRTKSRPADKKIEQVVSQLVRTLTSKKEVTAKDLEVVLEVTKTKIVESVNAQAITIFFAEQDGIHFRHISYSRSLYKNDPGAEAQFEKAIERLKKTVLPASSGIVGKVIRENRTHSTLDVSRDPQHHQQITQMTGFPVKTMITVPISYDKQVYGAIQCMNKNPASGEEFFSQKDIRLVEEVADYSARIIYMARNPGFKWGEEDVARYVARVAKLEYVDIREVEVEPALLQMIGEDVLRKFMILPLKKLGSKTIKASIDNPLELNRREGFELATDLQIEVLVVSPAKQISDAIDKIFKKQEADNISEAFRAELAEKLRAEVEKVDLAEDADKNSAPVIQLANRIIEDAYARGASDIHIEPFEKEVIIRYRADGVLEEKMRLPAAAIKPLTARYKIMAGLNIAEQRLPQDGRIMFKEFTKTSIDIDLRVAVGPMVFGEKTVMRILDKKTTAVGLDKMGYSQHNMDMYVKCCAAPFGMILHCGPTGSGKTTTLYAAVNFLNTPDMNIQTAEDPVEFMLPGINQMQIKPQIGLTFAKALKCYLRQDPDIILIGEIRDLEVAEIAIEAALTGHQVLSTLHTNDAAGTITRFVEMGVEPYLLTGAILCICAQRLMRKLCPACRQEQTELSEIEREYLKLKEGDAVKLYRAHTKDKGNNCNKCNGSGYKGRIGTHELLVMNGPLREICAKHAVSAAEIAQVALEKADMVSLFDDAMLKVKEGITDFAEALRTVRVEKN
ncbi:MAG TPA: GspE/PulE family protein [Planctomycetota bacterium]|nr:GspE/PulE family protein [Planctomycetota bacterium]